LAKQPQEARVKMVRVPSQRNYVCHWYNSVFSSRKVKPLVERYPIATTCKNGVLSGSEPNATDRRPLLRSAVLYPGRVSDAVGWSGVLTCRVRPVKPTAP